MVRAASENLKIMRTYTVKCDRCGKSETVTCSNEEKLGIMSVGVCVRDPQRYSSFSSVPEADVTKTGEWCKKCRLEVGVTKAYQEEDKKVAPKVEPTLEELLIQVLRDFVAEQIPPQQ